MTMAIPAKLQIALISLPGVQRILLQKSVTAAQNGLWLQALNVASAVLERGGRNYGHGTVHMSVLSVCANPLFRAVL